MSAAAALNLGIDLVPTEELGMPLSRSLPRLTGVVASCRSNFVFLSTLEGAVVAEHGILVSTSLGEDAIGESQLRDCVVESKLCSFLSMLVKRMFQQ